MGLKKMSRVRKVDLNPIKPSLSTNRKLRSILASRGSMIIVSYARVIGYNIIVDDYRVAEKGEKYFFPVHLFG